MRKTMLVAAWNSVKGMAHRGVWKQCLQSLLLLFGLCLGTGMPKIYAQAAQAPVSHGNLIYEGGRGSASLYAEDIHLLEEKIFTIPERCFDPVCYGHTHNWEYGRIDERTHTRHCAECGEANDLTSPHRAGSWERDTIFYGGNSYPAKRYTCVCGYQWSMEMSHTLIYEAVDEGNHQGRCALDGTPYCRGCEPSVEEHYTWYYEMGEDELHHEKICFDCGCRMEETCSFDEMEGDESRRVCVCGRSVEREEGSETPEADDAPEPSDEPETEEPPEVPDEPGTEDEPGLPDESGTEDAPETPDKPETGDTPETPDKPETGDTPETPDESGTGNTSETPDPPVTEDMPITPEPLTATLPESG